MGKVAIASIMSLKVTGLIAAMTVRSNRIGTCNNLIILFFDLPCKVFCYFRLSLRKKLGFNGKIAHSGQKKCPRLRKAWALL